MIQRAIVFATFGLAAACVSTAASARVDVGVFVNTPGPFYAPPPVVYAPPPPVVFWPVQPAKRDGYRGHGDHGRHRGWDKHHGHGR
jgi:hypothetical protein